MRWKLFVLGGLGMVGLSNCVADEGCTFTPTLECRVGQGCSARPTPVAESLILRDEDVAKPYLLLCFAGAPARCIQGPATVRRTIERETLSSAVLQNPDGLGGLPRKVMATLVYSWTDTLQGRATLYPVTGAKNAPMYLSAGECSGAG
ncbi:hypothetical protein [Pelomonas cellulosilytica]|uniref:Lipoprotein n=1 Tax=Pelomonas cellulosilytica TaxID=2906762 RepID=A0ABS8Y3T4_9BURK|nr:hypothetical protein [Pelomonas sp. P8]MCE4557849.1 hypothetical protein [Pelomonas sp. P8]